MLVHKDTYNEEIPEFRFATSGMTGIYRNTVTPAKAGILILYKDKKTSFHKI